ncbi:hypothetical protein [uncultured Eubacterium sp.]|uniref:hypothetical protein n=1 Tax=uncultured Eubacterium sp. TaxID=165185 RepID=UPI0025F72D05|nr:hypothetical protein [uncultured Eubacterium sp.]
MQKKTYHKKSKSLSGKSKQSLQYSPVLSGDENSAKALQYACLGGSLTVEAALIMPLLVVAAALALSLFLLIGLEVQMSEACHYLAGTMAASSIQADEPENVWGYAQVRQLLQTYQKEHGSDRWPGMEEVGNLTLTGSEFSGEQIRICVSYRLKLPISFGKWRSIPVTQQAVYRKWIGASEENSEEDENYVYVTPYGSVYHRSTGCRYLDLTVRAVGCTEVTRLRNKDGSIYYACHCANGATGSVYITDYGTSYHGKIDCSGLKRTVHKIPLSEVGNRQSCSQCGTKERHG